MSGDEQKLFYTTLNFLTVKHVKTERDNAFALYELITGRSWSYDYYRWYLPMLDEQDSNDARKQSEGQGKETSQ